MTKILAATLVVLLALPALASALEVLLQPVDHTVEIGGPARLRVLLSNPLDSSETWYVKPGFWVIPTIIPLEADLGLSFRVTGPDGNLLKARALPMILVRMKTEPEMLLRMAPGEILGVEVDLAELKIDLAVPGSYSVQATVATQAQEWFDEWLDQGGDPKRAMFKRSALFAGPLSSAPLALQVVERTRRE